MDAQLFFRRAIRDGRCVVVPTERMAWSSHAEKEQADRLKLNVRSVSLASATLADAYAVIRGTTQGLRFHKGLRAADAIGIDHFQYVNAGG
jgi:hypothetical protein